MQNDCWYEVLRLLDVAEKVKVERVCKQFQVISRSLLSQVRALGNNFSDLITIDCHNASHAVTASNTISSKLFEDDDSARRQLENLLKRTTQLECLHVQLRLDCRYRSLNATNIPLLCEGITALFSSITSTCPKLQCFAFNFIDERNPIVIRPSRLTDGMSPALLQLTNYGDNLRHLSLPFISPQLLRIFLAKCRNLVVVNAKVVDRDLEADDFADVSPDFEQLTGENMFSNSALQLFTSRCTKLRVLMIGAISQDMFKTICQQCAQLEVLTFGLKNDFEIVLTEFQELAKLTKLRRLEIRTYVMRHFDGALITIMKSIGQQLQQLQLTGFLLTDLSLTFMSKYCSHLSELIINCTLFALHNAFEENPAISDETMRSLARLTKLIKLDIECFNLITDQGLIHFLNSLKDMKYLRIWESKRNLITRRSLNCIVDYASRANNLIVAEIDNGTTDNLAVVDLINQSRARCPPNLRLIVRVASEGYLTIHRVDETMKKTMKSNNERLFT